MGLNSRDREAVRERSRKMFKRALFLFGIAAAVSTCVAGCVRSNVSLDAVANTNPNATVVTIGYLPITHALAVFKEKETLDSENGELAIKLQKFGNWSDLTDALNAGRIDGASVLIELAMSAKAKGVDLKAVALGHRDGNIVVVSNKIDDVKELKGKTIAIPSTQSSHYILVQDALARGGLTLDDVKIVQLAPTEMPFSLASRAIDAYCVAEPFGSQTVAQNFGKILYHSEDLWEDSLCCGLVLNAKAIEKLGDAKVAELVRRYQEAGNSLDHDSSVEIASKFLGQTPQVLDASLKLIHYDDLTITREAYDVLVEKVKKYGVNLEPPTFEDFVYQVQDGSNEL